MAGWRACGTSTAQQKLKRSAVSLAEPGRTAAWFASYGAECSAPPQIRHRAARAAAARSRSKTSSCSWNLASASRAWAYRVRPLK